MPKSASLWSSNTCAYEVMKDMKFKAVKGRHQISSDKSFDMLWMHVQPNGHIACKNLIKYAGEIARSTDAKMFSGEEIAVEWWNKSATLSSFGAKVGRESVVQ